MREQRQGLRFAEWTRRLTAEPPTVRAHDLYGGEHWNIARGLPTLVGASARLWVCSAGYGLVDVDSYLHPYAATFSIGTKDSVGRNKLESRQWWQRLTDWVGPSADKPRSFADLARQDPDATMVAVLSNTYLLACADDLRTAAGLLRSADKFTVIGPNMQADGLEDTIIPIPARLRSVVGGSLHALHARAAAHLLAQTVAIGADLSRENLREVARHTVDAAPPDSSRRAPGVRLSDDAVREYIRSHRHAEKSSATRLLRQLRDSGQSCEQGRFKQLYHEVAGEAEN
ncbi:hypothetical protein [Nocardia gipuzkoensis]|uniref:hypothetical protein n=1 Tax=Nocardia gipuzkoensis TaxID=2749991 RepID=UPI003EDF3A82